MSKVSIDRELLERLVAGWTQSTDVFGPMQELRAAMAQFAPAQDEREVAAVIGFYEGEREPRLLSWNVLPHGEHRLYIRPAQSEQQPVAEIVTCEPYEDGSTNPHNGVNWFGRNAENDLPAGTKLYAAPIAQTAPQGTTSDKHRAELYDEVWEKARSMGYSNVTDALVKLERMKAALQPEQSGLVEALKHVSEGAQMLQSLIDNIEAKGNYSQESTVLFLNQALGCIRDGLAAQGGAV